MSKQKIYHDAAEQFFQDYIEERSWGTTGACNMLQALGSEKQMKKFQDLFDCHGGNENNFETKYRKLMKKGCNYIVPIHRINEIRLLSLLFAFHAIDS
jgi:DNA integrity scanning protein DisA with diadenylate cyclase activity